LQAAYVRKQLDIGLTSLPPHWQEERMNLGMAIDGLINRETG